MKHRFGPVALALALLASACASSSKPVPPPPDKPAPGDLPAQNLAPGECGLFLWTKGEPRRFIFFARPATATANLMLSGEQQSLTLIRQGGSLFGQFMTELDYVDPAGLPVDVRIVPGKMVDGGQRIESGRMTLQDDGGWETIVPVVGLRACQAETE